MKLLLFLPLAVVFLQQVSCLNFICSVTDTRMISMLDNKEDFKQDKETGNYLKCSLEK